jgi:acetolactate synthase small subunit
MKRVNFVIEAENRAEVLARLVLLFHRLNVEIRALSMERRRDSETMRLRVTIEGEPDQVLRIEAHLYKAFEVRWVETRTAQSRAKLKPPTAG